MHAGFQKSELDAFFRPRSIAVIGASGDPRRIGGRPVDYLKRSGFAGTIYPINPNRDEVQGLKAYASLADVPGPVDQAILSIPVADTLAAIDACIAKGVKGVVIFTAGFGEVGGEGQAREDDIAARCRQGGIRMLGPNSLGFMNVGQSALSTFGGALEVAWPKSGSIGIVSQSGAIGTYFYTRLADVGLGISQFIATGNEADIDVAECMHWLADDPATKIIVAYLESCRSGARLRRALAHAGECGKPVLVLKAGVSEAGAEAVTSHTGSLAGSDAAFQTAFDEAGAYRADTMDEILDVARALSVTVLPRGRKVGIVSVSGGAGVLMADAAIACGLELPELPIAAQAEIKQLIPFSAPRNPIDSTAQIRNDFSIFGRILEIGVEQGSFDTFVTFFAYTGQQAGGMDPLKPVLFDLRRRYPDKPVFVCMTASTEVEAEFEQAGLFVMADPVRLMRTVAALTRLREALAEQGGPAVARAPFSTLPPGELDEAGAKAVLAEWGIPCVAERQVTNVADAVLAATELGFPVALKVLSGDLPHKSEAGGVALDLRNAKDVAVAWEGMMDRVKRSAPTARIRGGLVAPMVKNGVEVVLGVHRDPTFGPMAMFGIGGIFVEVYRDVAFRLAPLDMDAARGMIASVKGRALLEGVRGRSKIDIEAVADALVKLSQFAQTHEETIESVEVNPFIVLPKGGYVVDAAIVLRNKGHGDA